MLNPSYKEINFFYSNFSRPYLISNMIISSDGNALFTDKDNNGLGSDVDRRLMSELRFHADVVINGAETLRVCGSSSLIKEKELVKQRVSNGKSAHPIASVVTNSGNLPLNNRFFTSDAFDSIIFLGDEADQSVLNFLSNYCEEIVSVPKDNRARFILNYLYENYSSKIILLEGGPSINGLFFENNLIDEYFITISPEIFIPQNSFTTINPSKYLGIYKQDLILVSVQHSDESGEVFLRYKRKNKFKVIKS